MCRRIRYGIKPTHFRRDDARTISPYPRGGRKNWFYANVICTSPLISLMVSIFCVLQWAPLLHSHKIQWLSFYLAIFLYFERWTENGERSDISMHSLVRVQSLYPPPVPFLAGHPSKSGPRAAFSRSTQQPNSVFSQESHIQTWMVEKPVQGIFKRWTWTPGCMK